MSHLDEYPHIIDHSGQFTTPPAAFLLGLTQAPPSVSENLTPEQLKELNASTTFSGQAARTCYSSGGIVTPLDFVLGTVKHREITVKVAASTLESGHLSTRQHRTLNFGLYLSRYLAWVLHSQPFYNSEQVSQRYVSMSEESLMVPTGVHADRFFTAGSNLVQAYHRLKDLLMPTVKDALIQRFPGRKTDKWTSWLETESERKAQEAARYILPWGFETYMYFTITDLTLLRLHKLSQTFDIGIEAAILIDQMVALITQEDPTFLTQISDPLPLELTPEYLFYQQVITPNTATFATQFDQALSGQPILLDGPSNVFRRLADSIRTVFGVTRFQLDDTQTVDLVLDPNKNPLLASTLGEGVCHQLTQSLNQVDFNAQMRLSFAADSQFQRHRGFHHIRPIHPTIPDPETDIIIPALIAAVPEAKALYLATIRDNNRQLLRLLNDGVDPHTAAYIQVMGTVIRKRAKLPLGYLHPFIKLRTCLNAQEEIYHLAVQIARQINQLSPRLGYYFLHPAPCGLRKLAGITPYCSEGTHFCGDPRMWDLPVTDYPDRLI